MINIFLFSRENSRENDYETNPSRVGLKVSTSAQGYQRCDQYTHYIIASNILVALKEPNAPTPLSNPEIEAYPGCLYT